MNSVFFYETAALWGEVPYCSTRRRGKSKFCGEAFTSVSPAEGARGMSPRSAPPPPPPPPADVYPPYGLCALYFVKTEDVFLIAKDKVAMVLVFRGAQGAHYRQARIQVHPGVDSGRQGSAQGEQGGPLGEEDILPEAPPGSLRGGARIGTPRVVGSIG